MRPRTVDLHERSTVGAISIVGVLACLLFAGCTGGDPVSLRSCVFQDDITPNGLVDDGEQFVLTFSGPVRLRESASSDGFRAQPAGHLLGAYELRPVPDSDGLQILLVAGQGPRKLEPLGLFGNRRTPLASGLELDGVAISPTLSPRNGTWALAQQVVDVAVRPRKPAHLVHATWRDADSSNSISEGDEVDLRWSREVTISDRVKVRDSSVPGDMFVLPVRGDRLDDGVRHSYFRTQHPDTPDTLTLVLGSRPRFSPFGIFDPNQLGTGSSGIAVDGTSIRPQTGVLDRTGQGVADRIAVDIGGAFDPFEPVALPDDLEGDLVEFTLTSLGAGRVLLTGGFAPSRKIVSRFAYIYSSRSRGWSPPIPMTSARQYHTATYFPGWDQEQGTADDFVVVFGGLDGSGSVLADAEVLHPHVENPIFTRLEIPRAAARAMHTAHALRLNWTLGDGAAAAGQLLLVGGLGLQVVQGSVQLLAFSRPTKEGGVQAQIQKAGVTLRYPRANHQSIVIDQEEGLTLFVYGGVGGEGHQFVSTNNLAVLAAPEMVVFDPYSAHSRALDLAGSEMQLPGPRLGHKLALIPDSEQGLLEHPSVLLVGGGDTNSRLGAPLTPTRRTDYRTCYRVTFDLESKPFLRFERVDDLPSPRQNFGIAQLPRGDLLIVGGKVGDSVTAEALLFNPESDYFECFCHNLPGARSGVQLAPLDSDGTTWLVVGGGKAEMGGAVFRWREH